MTLPNPQSAVSKKEQVESMFDSIAGSYDFLNHFLSLGLDYGWRRKATARVEKHIEGNQMAQVLDVATGTGDLAIMMAKRNGCFITGLDLSDQMLKLATQKIAKENLGHLVTLCKGDSEKLVFADHSFDVATVSFGVRNFENRKAGLSEIQRVMKPGGTFVMLEFSRPEKFLIKFFYRFCFSWALPLVGRIISRDRRAYPYLYQSIMAFPSREDMLAELNSAGFKSITAKKLTGGVCTLYQAYKNNGN